MKKLTFKNKLITCLILLCLFFVQSCRKDTLLPAKGVNSLTIAEAKSYFEANFTASTTSKGKTMSLSENESKIPTYETIMANKQAIWDKAYKKMISVGGAVKIPIDFGKVRVVVDKTSEATMNLSALNYLLMYKDSLQNIHAEWVYLQPTLDWLNGNRTTYKGKVIIRDWNGKVLRKLSYGDTNSILNSSKISATKGATMDGNVNPFVVWNCFRVLTGLCAANNLCKNAGFTQCDFCLQQCAVEICVPEPECDNCEPPPSVGGTGSIYNGNGQSPSTNPNGGGGSTNPNDYVPLNCNPDPNYIDPHIVNADGSMSMPACSDIPIPYSPNEPLQLLSNLFVLTSNEQAFLLANNSTATALVNYLGNNLTNEKKEFVRKVFNKCSFLTQDAFSLIEPSLLNDLTIINSSSIQNEYVKALDVYVEMQELVAKFNDPSFNYLDEDWLYQIRELNRKIVEIQLFLAIYPSITLPEFINKHIENQFRIALLGTAKIIYPSITLNITEAEKQVQFNASADNSVAIMLLEFATGTGLNHRNFGLSDPITQKYLENGNLQKVKDEFYRVINLENKSYNEFKIMTEPLDGRMNYSPDHAGLRNSISAHFNSNLSQFFISGTDVFFTPTADDGLVEVRVYNETTKRSLMLHLGTNYARNPSPPNKSLSTISQNYKFRIQIDKTKINKP
jgi:hypothetical protein